MSGSARPSDAEQLLWLWDPALLLPKITPELRAQITAANEVICLMAGSSMAFAALAGVSGVGHPVR